MNTENKIKNQKIKNDFQNGYQTEKPAYDNELKSRQKYLERNR
jgi:hypothetical protein